MNDVDRSSMMAIISQTDRTGCYRYLTTHTSFNMCVIGVEASAIVPLCYISSFIYVKLLHKTKLDKTAVHLAYSTLSARCHC